jgi:hypothetical protein
MLPIPITINFTVDFTYCHGLLLKIFLFRPLKELNYLTLSVLEAYSRNVLYLGRLCQGVPNTTLCNKLCQFTCGCWFSADTSVASSNNTDGHDITEILLNVVLNSHNPIYKQ